MVLAPQISRRILKREEVIQAITSVRAFSISQTSNFIIEGGFDEAELIENKYNVRLGVLEFLDPISQVWKPVELTEQTDTVLGPGEYMATSKCKMTIKNYLPRFFVDKGFKTGKDDVFASIDATAAGFGEDWRIHFVVEEETGLLDTSKPIASRNMIMGQVGLATLAGESRNYINLQNKYFGRRNQLR